MLGEIGLALWTCTGLAWWLTAFGLVSREQRKTTRLSSQTVTPELSTSRRTLTIFKPLPPLSVDGLKNVAGGLESFVAQLDAQSEMLIGAHEVDRARVAPFYAALRDKFPKARIDVIWRSTPDDVANPKIAWQKILAPHARGELWLWSDADIVVPSHFLATARAEFGCNGETMMTFPYAVREIPHPAALLEVLFINVEFYPGVLLLRRCGPVDFGLGAAMLFAQKDFERRVDWGDIGAALADDFVLGQRLGPVRVGDTTLETMPSSRSWRAALAHDIRWAKTIRWNRPAGSFMRIVTMPLAGWLIAVALHPSQLVSWLGLVGMTQIDFGFGCAIARRAGCRLSPRDLAGVEFWTFWRLVLWLLCWLPWPVPWGGRVWHASKMELKSDKQVR